VLRAEELAEVAAARVEANREHLRISEAMEEAGVAAHFEVVQARTELARSEGDLIAAETGAEQARAGLRRLLYLPQTQALVVESAPPGVEEPEAGLGELVERAFAKRPEIRGAEAQQRAAEASVRLAAAGDNLTAALTGSYARNFETSTLSTNDSWTIALGLQQPIFTGGRVDAETEAARARLRQAELALETQKQEVALGVTQEYLALQQATQQLEVAIQGVAEAQERERISRVRFEAGVALGVEVLDAQTALAAAEANRVNAEYDQYVSLLRLYYAMGEPVKEVSD
jgi:outer membrane protein TolC